MTYQNSYSGALAHSNGKALETMIENGCAYYAQREAAQIGKIPEPMRTLENIGAGKFVACYTKRAQPDFMGVLPGGKAIVFEAKYTEKGTISADRVTETQAGYLDRYEALGAACFVLVAFRYEAFAMIPWGIWKSAEHLTGRKHWKLTDSAVQAHLVRRSGQIVKFLDFLEGAR